MAVKLNDREQLALKRFRVALEKAFVDDLESSNSKSMSAESALDYFHKTGESPSSKWQRHLFQYYS